MDPFTEPDAPITAKTKSRVTALGWTGVIFGVACALVGLLVVVAPSPAPLGSAAVVVLGGLGMAVASLLWARR